MVGSESLLADGNFFLINVRFLILAHNLRLAATNFLQLKSFKVYSKLKTFGGVNFRFSLSIVNKI